MAPVNKRNAMENNHILGLIKILEIVEELVDIRKSSIRHLNNSCNPARPAYIINEYAPFTNQSIPVFGEVEKEAIIKPKIGGWSHPHWKENIKY